MRLLFALLVLWCAVFCALVGHGCTPALRARVRDVTNGVAQVADAGGDTLRSRYCGESMAAIGRTGTWRGGHCAESGARAGTPATPDELAMLARVRERWAPVHRGFDAVAAAHEAVVDALSAESSASGGELIEALAGLAAAYEQLRAAARAVNVNLPSATGDQ